MKDHPERMILIAVAAALVVAIIGGAVACHATTAALEHTSFPSNDWLLEHGGNSDNGDKPGNDAPGTEKPGDGNGSAGSGSDSQGADDDLPVGGNDDYTERDVPASMDIDTAELQDDLQACINNDLMNRLLSFDTLDFTTVELSDLTKDAVAAPELKGGRVLSKASGKVTVKTSAGQTETIDYTSYYYAADPTASKITWYIYAYDLGSYDLFPDGFKDVSGDPIGVREKIESGIPASNSELGRDKEGSQQAA